MSKQTTMKKAGTYVLVFLTHLLSTLLITASCGGVDSLKLWVVTYIVLWMMGFNGLYYKARTA